MSYEFEFTNNAKILTWPDGRAVDSKFISYLVEMGQVELNCIGSGGVFSGLGWNVFEKRQVG